MMSERERGRSEYSEEGVELGHWAGDPVPEAPDDICSTTATAASSSDSNLPFSFSTKRRRLWPYGPEISVAAMANLGMSYNVVIISLSLEVMESLFGKNAADFLVTSTLIAGMMAGQLLFGGLGDHLGRPRALAYTLLLCVVGALGSAVLTPDGPNVFVALSAWRFLLGFGAGGVYPLAATTAREGAAKGSARPVDRRQRWQEGGDAAAVDDDGGARQSKRYARAAVAESSACDGGSRNRGSSGGKGGGSSGGDGAATTAVAVVFAVQGVGYLLAPLTQWLLISLLGESEATWRLALGLGAVLPLITAVAAFRLPAAVAAVAVEAAATAAAEEDSVPLSPARTLKATPPDSLSRSGTAAAAAAGGAAKGSEPDRAEEAVVVAASWKAGRDKSPQQVLDRPPLQSPPQPPPSRTLPPELSSPPRRQLAASLPEPREPPVPPPRGVIGQLAKALAQPGMLRLLLGTAGSWALFDVTFYGNTLFAPQVIRDAFGAAESTATLAAHNAALAALALPGYGAAAVLMGRVGPRRLQIWGFAAMALLYVGTGAGHGALEGHGHAALTLFGLTFFVANVGPNSTTFAMPSLVFPAAVRGSMNGVSAACGKLGALLGAAAFAPLADAWGIGPVLVLCGIISAGGGLLTLALVPTTAGRPAAAPRGTPLPWTGMEVAAAAAGGRDDSEGASGSGGGGEGGAALRLWQWIVRARYAQLEEAESDGGVLDGRRLAASVDDDAGGGGGGGGGEDDDIDWGVDTACRTVL